MAVDNRHFSWKSAEARAAYFSLAPTVVVAGLFVVFPLAFSLFISLHEWPLAGRAKQFIGFQNYATAFADPRFWASVGTTLLYAGGVVVGGTALALAVAAMLRSGVRGLGLYRSVYFAPHMTSSIVIGLIWTWVFNVHDGPVNRLLAAFGVAGPDWFAEPVWALMAVIAASVWHGLGYNVVILLAGLQAVPEQLYEAAALDGASRWRMFWHITLPGLQHALGFVVVMGTIQAFQAFGQIYVMTGGGPMESTMVLVYYIYREGFEFFRMGYASAVAWILTAVIFLVSLLQLRRLNRRTAE